MSYASAKTKAAAELLGTPPAVRAEDSEAHAGLLARMIENVHPRDFTEGVLVSDVAYHVAQTRFLRRLEASLLKAATLERLLERLKETLPLDEDPSELAVKWAQQDPDAIKLVNATLAKAGLDMDALLADAFALNIAKVVAIKELISKHEKRHAAARREIEHHREALAEPVGASKEAQDAEYEDLRRGAGNGGRA